MFNEQKALCLFGAGGHGRVVASQIKRLWDGEICFGDSGIDVGQKRDGLRIRFSGIQGVIDHQLLITIGDNDQRASLFSKAHLAGHELVSFVAEPERYYAEPPDVGSMLLSGAIINIGAKIGRGVIVNSGAIVEHDCCISDFVHLAPGSIMGGNSKIGEYSFLGTNATILPGLSIAKNVVIGAGAVVTRNIRKSGVYAGMPARRIDQS